MAVSQELRDVQLQLETQTALLEQARSALRVVADLGIKRDKEMNRLWVAGDGTMASLIELTLKDLDEHCKGG